MGVLVYAVFNTFLKHVVEIHRVKEFTEVIEYKNVFWSDFCQKWLDFGSDLVRFSGKIGQVVGQILESFSQILIIFTLGCICFVQHEKKGSNLWCESFSI